MKPPIPVTVVSGFLGSGKTTLLCDLLEHRQEMRLAVLINEVGEVSVDGALARASAGGRGRAGESGSGSGAGGMGDVSTVDGTQQVEIFDFPSGLIAYAEDTRFVPTLQAIARRPGRVDHVLIETSGVALPSAAMERLQSPELARLILSSTRRWWWWTRRGCWRVSSAGRGRLTPLVSCSTSSLRVRTWLC